MSGPYFLHSALLLLIAPLKRSAFKSPACPLLRFRSNPPPISLIGFLSQRQRTKPEYSLCRWPGRGSFSAFASKQFLCWIAILWALIDLPSPSHSLTRGIQLIQRIPPILYGASTSPWPPEHP